MLVPLRRTIGRTSVLLGVFAVFSLGLPAHAEHPGRIIAEGAFVTVLPQGSYRDAVPRTGFGFDGLVAMRIADLPVYAGLDFGWYTLGHGDEEARPGQPNLFDPRGSITDNTLQSHIVLRYQPSWKYVRPYVEGLVGFRYLFATRYFNESTSTIQSDVVGSWGLGAGVTFGVFPNQRSSELFKGMGLSVGARYLWGSTGTYLSVDTSSGYAVFRRNTSRTDVLVPYVALSFLF